MNTDLIVYPKRIELELTLRCNNACPTCNRHCNVYDPFIDSPMSAEQIERFIKQVEDRKKVWNILAVVGGEPTTHPAFAETVRSLWDRLVCPGLVHTLQIWTNTKIPIDLGDLPTVVLGEDDVSVPDGKIHIVVADHTAKIHYQAFLAPKDTGQVRGPCEPLGVCGFVLNAYGYWPCGPGSAIARLFGWYEYAKQELPDSAEDWGDLEQLCELCQHATMTKIPLAASWKDNARREISPTYRKAIRNRDKLPPCPKWQG